jgi:hypothetical protein
MMVGAGTRDPGCIAVGGVRYQRRGLDHRRARGDVIITDYGEESSELNFNRFRRPAVLGAAAHR